MNQSLGREVLPGYCGEWGHYPVSSPYTQGSALGAQYAAHWWVMEQAVEIHFGADARSYVEVQWHWTSCMRLKLQAWGSRPVGRM